MKSNFWSLLADHKIVVPIIQRDYAQGRQHSKAKSIREQFVATLLHYLLTADATLELDFIYGAKVEDALVILDGQQRLTTLYLLHLYLASHVSDLKPQDISLYFARFGYETRHSSRDFLNSLIKHYKILKITDPHDITLISKRIKNEIWYFSIWDKDPSIQSMLIMLDEIDRQFGAYHTEFKAFWQALTEQQKICFYFLEMKNFGLTDQLYIKMNARGVHLTEFENFKAWLVGQINTAWSDEFFSHMDKAWTDLFWQLRPQQSDQIDDIFYECFKIIACASLGLQYDERNTKSIAEKNLIERLRATEKPYIDVKEYLAHDIFNATLCKGIFYFLDALILIKTHSSELFGRMCNDFLELAKEKSQSNSRLFSQTYQGYLLVYSVYAYFEKLMTQINLDRVDTAFAKYPDILLQAQDFYCICNRLLKNKTHDNVQDYSESLKDISQLAQVLDLTNVVSSLATLQQHQFTPHRRFNVQFKEEHIKANLICQGWDKIKLEQYASHYSVNGQILFLIDWSKGQQDVFQAYAEKLITLFECTYEHQQLLQRSLLCYGDYLTQIASKHTLCVMHQKQDNRTHNENWRDVFNHPIDSMQPTKSNYLKQLLDDLPQEITRTALENIISAKKSNVKDWRRYLIEYPQTIEYCGPKKYIEKNEYDGCNKKRIYLLKGVKKTTYVELVSYTLYCGLKDIFKDHIGYRDASYQKYAFCIELEHGAEKFYLQYNQAQHQFSNFSLSHDIPAQLKEVDLQDDTVLSIIPTLQKQLLDYA